MVFDLLCKRFVHGAHSIRRRQFVTVPGTDGKVGILMRVWIDQDLCTGDGLCVDHCPDVFVQLEDGIAYVAEARFVLNDPGGGGSLARVAARNEQAVIHAALACPGECIFIDVQHVRAA
jgi:ferredoxin